MAAPCRIVTLTTDFGLRDTFVGQVVGSVLSVDPGVRVVDLTHDVPPHDVTAGAFLLETAVGSFPVGTVHVAVVDPGVGTDRAGVAVETERGFFVGPDNGVLSRALHHETVRSIHRLDVGGLRQTPPSATFHGRDVFGPAAARLATGTSVQDLGPALDDLAIWLPAPPGHVGPGPTEARVLWIDRFGNATIDVPRAALGPDPTAVRITTPHGVVDRLVRTYADGGAGPIALWNSAKYLEIAVRNGRADDTLRLRPGTVVTIEPSGT